MDLASSSSWEISERSILSKMRAWATSAALSDCAAPRLAGRTTALRGRGEERLSSVGPAGLSVCSSRRGKASGPESVDCVINNSDPPTSSTIRRPIPGTSRTRAVSAAPSSWSPKWRMINRVLLYVTFATVATVTTARVTKAEKRGARSRDLLLDAAERLMAEKGYAAAPVSAICKAAGVPVTSLYWHFGSKDGLLATVMERGADRWFASLPPWEEQQASPGKHPEVLHTQGADAVAANPNFLRLFYILAIEGRNDELAAELVQRVRGHALAYFRAAIEHLLKPLCDAATARIAAEDLARFAVAFSDGCFFALQLEPDTTDLRQMYADLTTAIRALAPTAISRARSAAESRQESP